MTAAQLIAELSKMSPDTEVFLVRNHGTDDEWRERIERVNFVPVAMLVCDEENQI